MVPFIGTAPAAIALAISAWFMQHNLNVIQLSAAAACYAIGTY